MNSAWMHYSQLTKSTIAAEKKKKKKKEEKNAAPKRRLRNNFHPNGHIIIQTALYCEVNGCTDVLAKREAH